MSSIQLDLRGKMVTKLENKSENNRIDAVLTPIVRKDLIPPDDLKSIF